MLPLWTFEKHLPYPISAVETVLFDLPEGPFTDPQAPFLLAGSGSGTLIMRDNGQYTVEYEQGHKASVFLDKSRHLIALQGAWWYRGEYHLTTTTANTTLLQLRVFNVANRFRWAALLMTWPEKNRHHQAFEAFVSRLKVNIVR